MPPQLRRVIRKGHGESREKSFKWGRKIGNQVSSAASIGEASCHMGPDIARNKKIYGEKLETEKETRKGGLLGHC